VVNERFPRQWTEDEAHLLSLIANDTAQALERARLFEAEQNRRQEAEMLSKASTILVSTLDINVILKNILTQLEVVIPFDSASVILQEDMHLKVVAWKNLPAPEQVIGKNFPLDNVLFMEIQQTGQALILTDAQADSRFKGWGDTKNIHGWMAVPLIAKGKIFGYVTFDSYQIAAYGKNEATLAQAFANQAATALENARLFDQAQQRALRLAALREIDMTITGTLDLDISLDFLLTQAIEQLAVDAADILLYQNAIETLEFITGHGFQTKNFQHTDLFVGRGYAGQAVLYRKPVYVPDLTKKETSFPRSLFFKEEGFVSYYGLPLIAKGNLVGVLEIFQRSPLIPNSEWKDFIETLAGQAAIAIDNVKLFEDLRTANIKLATAYDSTIKGWARALELRDTETEGHSKRVVKLTLKLARNMGIKGKALAYIRRGALLHDIGKMAIPTTILQKSSALTEEEWEILRQHPLHAYTMLKNIEYLRPALDIPLYHHEHWDGSGYPNGLREEQIPIAARIFIVVDVWDALTINRSYRAAWPKEKVVDYIKENAGILFDPQVVKGFFRIIENGII